MGFEGEAWSEVMDFWAPRVLNSLRPVCGKEKLIANVDVKRHSRKREALFVGAGSWGGGGAPPVIQRLKSRVQGVESRV